MNAAAALQPYYGNDCPFDKAYKIYSDGSHYIARPQVKGVSRKYKKRPQTEIDVLFDELYKVGVRSVLDDSDKSMQARAAKLVPFILTGLEDYFPYYPDLEKYVRENVERKERNAWQREKRFRRKAYLNKWNFFVTFTYSNRKHTEETFKKKLRKCLANLATRRGWRFMGVPERGEKTNRLHYHFLLYIPRGEMVGVRTKKRDYSMKTGMLEETFSNSFFERKFGRNDFEELNVMEMKSGEAVGYLLKYLRKTGERVIYSRGIPTEIEKRLDESVFAAAFENDNAGRQVLFDNVIEWRRDIYPLTRQREPIAA